jgi:nucleoside-diphosphate-sugar epimerase
MTTTYLVTGGTGFIGSALVRRLVQMGHRVRSLDNQSRGCTTRLADVRHDVEFVCGDIRDADVVRRAARGVDVLCHLAYVNGTEFFYSRPELVLDVAVKGMVNVIDACLHEGIPDLVLASSSEVYQTPPVIPTDETVPLCVPDPLNPRYSYGGGKIISELMALVYGRKHIQRVRVFRPHNVYGPDMGWEHVIPQFALRMRALVHQTPRGVIRFPIQGSGQETRSFIFIDDMVDGLLRVIERGEHLGIYHIGTQEEVTIEKLAQEIGKYYQREAQIVPGKLQEGSPSRRCPNIGRLAGLGFAPCVSLAEGLERTVCWYDRNAEQRRAA